MAFNSSTIVTAAVNFLINIMYNNSNIFPSPLNGQINHGTQWKQCI